MSNHQHLGEPLLESSTDPEEDMIDGIEIHPRPSTSGMTPRTVRPTISFAVAVVFAVLPMFLFGYNIGVLNAPEKVIFPGHTIHEWSTAVSSFSIGGIVGANVSGKLADRYGRRTMLLVSMWVHVLGGFVHFFAPNMFFLIVGRVVVGVSGGAATVLTPMYLGEISPKSIRGSVGTLAQLAVVLGILASVLMALPFATESLWRLLFAPILGLSLINAVFGQRLLPESPRWLLLNHYVPRGLEARGILRRFRGCEDEEVELEVVQTIGNTEAREENGSEKARITDEEPLTKSRDEETFDDDDDWMASDSAENSVADRDLETSPTFRYYLTKPNNFIPVVSSIVFPVAQQLSGINAVFYYSTSFFEGVIDDPQTGTIIAFVINVLATILALCVMDRFGRRTLLAWSAGGMFVCCIILTLALKGILSNIMTVAAVMVYIVFFEVGLGCIPFFLASEMIESNYLGQVQSIAMSLNWLANFGVGMGFPYVDKYLGSYSFVPFGAVLLATTVFALFWLPETRGKSQEEVIEEVARRRGRGRELQEAVALSSDPDQRFV